MNWYKFAKLNKQAFKMELLYNFYLIASLSKEDILHYLKSDKEFKYYIVHKLNEIKNKYLKDGLKIVNGELSHRDKEIENFSDFNQAAHWFETLFRGDFAFGGPKWAEIALALYDLYLFPDLEKLYWDKSDNSVLVEFIYKLIRKIDYFNDLAHNSDLALLNMIDDSSGGRVKYFLDYKHDYDIKDLARFFPTDRELLGVVHDIGAKPFDFQNSGKLSLLFSM